MSISNNRQAVIKMPARDEGFSTDRFFTLSLDLLCVAGFDGYFKRLNPMWFQTLGFTTEELLAKPFIEFVHPEDREATRAVARKLSAGIHIISFENRYKCKDGSYKWLLWNAESFREEQLIYAAARDITDRKQVEVALQESEELFRAIAQTNPAPTIITRISDSSILYANLQVGTTIGLPSSKMIGRYALDFYNNPIERQKLLQILQTDGVIQNRELCLKKANGTPFWASVSIQPMTFNGEQALLYAFYDINDRKRTEEALRHREEQFRTISEAIPHPLIISRISDGTVLYANGQVAPTFGISISEVIGYKSLNLYYDSTERQTLLEKLLRDGYVTNSEVRGKRTDGTLIWFSVSLRSLTFNGEPAAVWVLYDITERKLAEEVLRETVTLRTLAADVGVALSAGGTITEILQQCTETMVLHLEASGVGIWTFNPETKELEPAIAIAHPPLEYFQQSITFGKDRICFSSQLGFPHFKAEYQPFGSVKLGGANVGLEESNNSFSSTLHLTFNTQRSSFASYPLIVEDRLIGAIALFSDVEITSAVHSMLGWIANAVAVAIDRYWARQELLSRREALLFQLANQIRNSLDLDTILETAVKEIRNLLQIDRCAFMWYRPVNCKLPILGYGLKSTGEQVFDNSQKQALNSRPFWEVAKAAKKPDLPSQIGCFSTAEVLGSLGEKLLNLEIIRIDEVETLEDRSLRELLISLSHNSILLLPLQTYSGEIGVIRCTHSSQPRPWSDSEVELLQAVRDQLAIAINQAELYAHARETAQQAILAAQQLEQTLTQLQQTQTQLIQTEKMSSLGQMIAGIAHEINNPVTFISGNLTHASQYTQDLLGFLRLYQQHYPIPAARIQEEAETIDVDFLIEDLPKVISSMHIGAERIHQIVISLRNFSRLDEAEKKPVDIHEGIDNTLLILQHRLKPKGNYPGVEIVKEYQNLPPVECYAGQLNQVFMNIISNAIDAMENQPEPRIITIATEMTPGSVAGEDWVLIRIRDNGSGMSEEVRKRLFDPFFTTKPVGKGTGLGLSISYQIVVEKHGGLLQCYSQPGQGSEFQISIPLGIQE